MNSIQNGFQAIQEKITSIGWPALALGGAGILLVVIALKLGKGVLKLVLLLVAAGAVGGAIYWYLHRR